MANITVHFNLNGVTASGTATTSEDVETVAADVVKMAIAAEEALAASLNRRPHAQANQ